MERGWSCSPNQVLRGYIPPVQLLVSLVFRPFGSRKRSRLFSSFAGHRSVFDVHTRWLLPGRLALADHAYRVLVLGRQH